MSRLESTKIKLILGHIYSTLLPLFFPQFKRTIRVNVPCQLLSNTLSNLRWRNLEFMRSWLHKVTKYVKEQMVTIGNDG